MLGSGDVAQLGELRVRNAKVGSSILLVSTILSRPTFTGWAFSFRGFDGAALGSDGAGPRRSVPIGISSLSLLFPQNTRPLE